VLTPQGRRYGLAVQSDGSSFEAPARWVADVAIELPTHIHAVDRSRQLCAKALGYELTCDATFGLLASAPSRGSDRPLVALIHGTSRADKQWPVACWQALGQNLIQQGYRIALPCGSDAEEQVARQVADGLTDAEVWSHLELDVLTDALAACAGVIGVDSGLSHIAVALNLRHVQIYNFDTAWRTGPRDPLRQCSVFASPTPSVDAVWQAWCGLTQKTGST
jgi:heptosyltransferase-1